jgi:glucans biosynthesis protein
MHRSGTRPCGVRTRADAPCRTPVIKGRSRCRMHGGTSTGAPKGNQYALKHGRYSMRAEKERALGREVLQALRTLIEQVDHSTDGLEGEA